MNRENLVGETCENCTLSGDCGSCVESLHPVEIGGKKSYSEKIKYKERWILKDDRRVAVGKEGTDEAELHTGEKENCKLSDNLADSCRTVCLVCGLSFTLSGMRSHTKQVHKMQITSYKEKFGQITIIDKVYHKCHICGKVVLLDNDVLGGHVKHSHKVKEKDYKEMFMTSNTNLRSSTPSSLGKDTVNHILPLGEIRSSTPVKYNKICSINSTPPSAITLSSALRRNSRSKKCRRSSKLHLLPVEYSSDGSEGSLSDLEDMLARCVLNSPVEKHYDADIVIDEGTVVEELGVSSGADDELSVDEAQDTAKLKIKRKSKRKTDLKKSPRRMVLLKQTEDMLNMSPKVNRMKQSNTKPPPIDDKSVYHGRNFLLKRTSEEVEMDCDFTWMSRRSNRLLNDISDVNEAEKTLMILWNEHIVKLHGLGIRNVQTVLDDFVSSYFSSLSEHSLYCNFVSHVVALEQAGLISMANMVNCMEHLQDLVNKSQLDLLNNKTKGYSNSESDLTAILSSLDLDHVRADESSVDNSTRCSSRQADADNRQAEGGDLFTSLVTRKGMGYNYYV